MSQDHTIQQGEVHTLDGLFRERVKRSADLPAYREYDAETDTWQQSSWGEMGEEVARWQAALYKEPLQRGDKIAVMLANSRAWVCCEQAAMGMGLVLVPLYTNDRAENVAFILQDAGIKLLVIGGDEHWQQLTPIHAQLDGLARIVSVFPCHGNRLPPRMMSLQQWLPERGEGLVANGAAADEMCCIVYTSGTTGRPKGVMLSHKNILLNAYGGVVTADLDHHDLFLSFLPLSHMLERTAGYYIPMIVGAEVAYARSVSQLAEDLLIVRPTALISVPRIYERVYGKISTQLAEKSPIARKLFAAAISVGWHRFLNAQGRGGWWPSFLLWPLLNKLVAGKIMDKLGGRLKLAICGGAPLSPDVAQTFIGLGLNLRQGYGLTETSPVISVCRDNNNIPSSVGEALQGVEVMIGDNDELLTRSESVMLGYWNNPQATHEMIDSDGWLHTGDKARIDNGVITITGRIKEIIVLSNGEKVPPADMEMAIAMDPLFEQCMVLGEGKPYLSLLAVLNPEQFEKLEMAINDPHLEERILARVAEQIREFPGYAQIRRVYCSLDPWTIEQGLITPTLKLKRKRVLEHYQTQVAELYQGH